MLMWIFAAIVFAVVLVISSIAVAQDSPEMAGEAWDIMGTIYTLVGGILVAGLGWLGKKLIEFVSAKTENEWIKGALSRLVGSISDAVAMVNQTLKKEILAAKDPNSPGGARITKEEGKQLREAVLDALKQEYGGWEGILKLLKRIGIGDQASAEAKLGTMIEAAVSGQKKNPQ
jgi:hypothetical protein